MSDNRIDVDDIEERRVGKQQRSQAAAPVAQVDTQALARALLEGSKVQAPEREVYDGLRCKVRVQAQHHGQLPYVTYDRDKQPVVIFERGDVVDASDAGRPLKFGATVYMTARGFKKYSAEGVVMRMDL
jgi:hypothetical protein